LKRWTNGRFAGALRHSFKAQRPLVLAHFCRSLRFG
jgi:hypothetical protein